MALEVAAHTLADRRRSLIYWVIGIASYVLTIVAFYPTIRDQAQQFNEMIANYPKAMLQLFTGGGSIDFGSPSDFVNTYLYASMVPIAVLVLAIGFGSSAIAGEEDAGTLDLLLSYPITRRSVVLQKALVLLVEVAVVGTAMAVLLVAGRGLVGLDLPIGNLALATLALILLGLDFGLLALALSAATGHKGLAAGVASGVAAATYLVSSLSSLATWMKPFRYLSPFFYATDDNPLGNSMGVGRLAVLAAVALVALAVAVVGFDRRDPRG